MLQRDLFAEDRPPPAALICDRKGKPVWLQLLLMLKPSERPAWQLHRSRQALCRDLKLTGFMMPPPRLHITLLQIGSYWGRLPAEVLPAVQAALRNLEQREVPVGFDHLHCAATGQALVLRGGDEAPIRHLGARLHQQLNRHGLEPRRSSPHMSLVYRASHEVRDIEIAPLHWTASDVVLVLSPQGLSRHDHLARWALQH